MKPSVVGFHRHFLFLEDKEGILVVNLQAAAARLYFDGIKSEGGSRQTLLLPYTFTFSAHEAMKIEERLDQLQAAGIGVRSLGAGSFIVDELAPELTHDDVERAMNDLPLNKERDLALYICQKIRKTDVTRHQALEIYERLQQSSSPDLCPLGRPITTHLNEDRLERLFN